MHMLYEISKRIQVFEDVDYGRFTQERKHDTTSDELVYQGSKPHRFIYHSQFHLLRSKMMPRLTETYTKTYHVHPNYMPSLSKP